jgi:hypothetical protein
MTRRMFIKSESRVLGLCGSFEDYMAVGNLELLLGVSTSFRRVLGVLGGGISVHRIRIGLSYRKRQVFEREHPKFIGPF